MCQFKSAICLKDRVFVPDYDSASVILPRLLQTQKPVELSGKAICINHRDHTIQSPIKWKLKQ